MAAQTAGHALRAAAKVQTPPRRTRRPEEPTRKGVRPRGADLPIRCTRCLQGWARCELAEVAVPDVAARAAYVTRSRGGHGAIREIVELILRAQGKWDAALSEFTD